MSLGAKVPKDERPHVLVICDAGRTAARLCLGQQKLEEVVKGEWMTCVDPWGRTSRFQGGVPLLLHLCPVCVEAEMPPDAENRPDLAVVRFNPAHVDKGKLIQNAIEIAARLRPAA